MRPILLNSCALATSAAEARFRIDAPIEGRRGARVVALDDDAATIVRRLAHQQWNGARFFTLVAGTALANGTGPTSDGNGDGSRNEAADMALHRTNGTDTRLDDELVGADVVVMLATADGSAAAASAIGRACARRGIMTAGLVLGNREDVGAIIFALRPHAQVLLVTTDDQDVHEVLTALRA